jgi:hypothetical protein
VLLCTGILTSGAGKGIQRLECFKNLPLADIGSSKRSSARGRHRQWKRITMPSIARRHTKSGRTESGRHAGCLEVFILAGRPTIRTV